MRLQTEDGRQDAAQRLLREAWVTGLLEHPNVIPVHTLGVDEHGAPMIVMKMVEGTSWAEAIKDSTKLPAAFRDEDDPFEAHLRVLMQVCQAVHFAHSKAILHRDLKPDNVMLGHFGEVYLLDWGIAVSMACDGTGRLPLASQSREISGTPGYMAPEMAAGEGERLGPWTDVYLLGAILHELVTGRLRHDEPSLIANLLQAYQSTPYPYGPEVPAELAHICNRATAREPAERYESAEAFRLALVSCLRHRESRRLTQEAQIRLDDLEALVRAFLSSSGVDDLGQSLSPPSQIYERFAQARFGFEQALRIWRENAPATRGLEQALVTMVDLELRLGDEKAASLLLADLEAPDPALVERLERLRAQLEKQGKELDHLRKFAHDNDLRLASRARARLTLVLGVFLGALPLLNSALVRSELVAFSFTNYFIQYAVALAGVGVLVFRMHRQVIKNAVNYRFVLAIFLALLGGLVARILGWMLGLDVAGATALEGVSYAASVMMMGLLMDRRLFPAAAAFVIGALAMASWPAWVLEIDAASNVAALWLTALVWWVRADDEPVGLS
jgi:eukaryotic-like serine/threonine-protein kinase